MHDVVEGAHSRAAFQLAKDLSMLCFGWSPKRLLVHAYKARTSTICWRLGM